MTRRHRCGDDGGMIEINHKPDHPQWAGDQASVWAWCADRGAAA
jgi:hypothetical protein